MTTGGGITWLVAAMFAVVAPSGSAAAVEVTYLGNEGVLVTAGERKVLIDALFGAGIEPYPAPPAELRREAEAATGPFAGVDVVLATHDHGDHFDAAAVARHLRANPTALFVSTPQAVERLRRETGTDPALAGRIRAAWPAEGGTERLEHAGITIEALNLHHGRDRDPPVQNLGFVIELGSEKILHVGDTELVASDAAASVLTGREIDVGFLPYWLFFDPFAELPRRIGARNPVLVHVPFAAPAAFYDPAKDVDDLERLVRVGWPSAWLPRRGGETRSYGTP